MRKKQLLRFCSAAAAVSVLVCALSVPHVNADDMTDRYNALQQQQQSLQKTIDSQNSKLSSEKQKKAALDSSIKVIIQQMSILNSQIASLNSQITAKNKDIAATQADIDKNYELFKQQLRAMYESGDASYIRVLLTSESFTDFLQRAEVLKVVSQHNNDLLDKLNADEQKLKADQASLQASQASLQTSKSALTAKQADVGNQVAQQSAIVNSATQDVNASKSQKSLVDSEINAIVAQWAAQSAAAGRTGSSSAVVNYAYTFLDPNPNHTKNVVHPYMLGTIGPKYYDCSGFTATVFSYFGQYLPHDANAQYNYGSHVSKDNLLPGDLVFFNTEGGYGYMSHVGIYVGNNEFIAANSSTGIAISGLFSSAYWNRYYRGATRIFK